MGLKKVAPRCLLMSPNKTDKTEGAISCEKNHTTKRLEPQALFLRVVMAKDTPIGLLTSVAGRYRLQVLPRCVALNMQNALPAIISAAKRQPLTNGSTTPPARSRIRMQGASPASNAVALSANT